MSKTIKIAVVGCGYWGPNLIRNFYEIPKSEVLVCCDLNRIKLENIKRKYHFMTITEKFSDILNNKDIDAVAVATPPGTHYKLARDILLANKHVFIEKPITLNSKDAEDLIKIAKQKKRILMVGHTFEYSPAVNKLKELINSGELGKIHYIYTNRLNLGLFQNTNVIWDLATHDISIVLYLSNKKPVSVLAKGKSHIQEGIEDVAFITLTFEDGSIAHFHVSWLDPCKVRKTVIVGDKKMVVYDDVEPLEKLKVYEKGVSKHDDYSTFGEFQLSYNYGDIIIPKIDNAEPLKIECTHFLDCIETGKTPRSSGEVGLLVVKILEAAEKSVKNGGEEVKLK